MTVNQTSEDGNVELHDKVIQQIIYTAVSEIDGVRLVNKSKFHKFAKMLVGNQFPGVNIVVRNNEELAVDLQLYIKYGLCLPTVAKEVQDKVKKIVKKTANITPKNVDVHILGVERG